MFELSKSADYNKEVKCDYTYNEITHNDFFIMTILVTLNTGDITYMTLLTTLINATLHKCFYLLL